MTLQRALRNASLGSLTSAAHAVSPCPYITGESTRIVRPDTERLQHCHRKKSEGHRIGRLFVINVSHVWM